MNILILALIRYLFGYINFRAYGGLSDRFLNLCTQNSIPLWNMSNVKGNITATTTVEGYLAIRKPAQKSGMKVVCLEKKGLRFFLKRNKARMGILAGIIICGCIFAILSQFVWSVSVTGNTSLTEEYILDVFYENGVRVGAPISSIDSRDVAQRVVSQVDELSWAAVNRKGAVVVIEVRERTVPPEIYDDKTPTNVIATEDGVILSIDVLYGNEEVKVGSAVTKGDLLISGVITHADGTEAPIHGDGYVRALVKKRHSSYGDTVKLYEMESEKTVKSIFFFGIELPLGKRESREYISIHNTFLESEKIRLPLGIITRYGANPDSERFVADEVTQKRTALFGNALYIKKLLDGCEVSDSVTVMKKDEKGWCCHFTGECEQQIGKLQEIYVEKSDDNE